jgi:hypothetical protein
LAQIPNNKIQKTNNTQATNSNVQTFLFGPLVIGNSDLFVI